MQNAETVLEITVATGEPCASKVACTVRRGADGKGRRRFPVSRRQAHELRHKTYLASRLPDLLRQEQSGLAHHVEHIVARQHGGADDPDNLALACNRCNASKGP